MTSASRGKRARPAGRQTVKSGKRALATSAPRAAAKRPTAETALAMFAHEIRTPLTGILAITDLLATSELGERQQGWVSTVKASAEHLAALTTLYVDAARAGRVSLRNELFDLHVFARRAGESLAGRATAKGLGCDVSVSGRNPGWVAGDAILLRAALENLIDNAVKFTDAGRVGLKVTCGRAAKGKVVVAFAVSDHGIGLTLAEIKRLFRPFSQAHAGIAVRYGGAGLGLSSARHLARAMGGDIDVRRQRRGSIFTLRVMLSPAPPDALLPDGDSEAATRSLHVLSVEDNPFGRVVVNALLTELGHHTTFLGDGESAIARIGQGGVDAILMDMVLPGIGGVETIRRIRALGSPHGQVPIIGLSGNDSDDTRARAAGANAFLVKPVSARALATALLAATRRGAAAT